MNLRLILLVLAVVLGVFCEPPVYKKIPTWVKKHGKSLLDNYSYLSKNNATYLKTINTKVDEENNYGGSILDYRLYLDIEALVKNPLLKTNQSTTMVGDYTYFASVLKNGKQKWYRMKTSGSAKELILDEEKFAKQYLDGKLVRIVTVKKLFPSPDGKFVAFSYDLDFSERNLVAVVNMDKGTIQKELNCTGNNFGWSTNSEFFMYEYPGCDEHGSSQIMSIMVHKVGEHPREDFEIAKNTDEKFELRMSKSSDGKYYFINYESYAGSYVEYVSSSFDKSSVLVTMRDYTEGIFYKTDHSNDKFFYLNNFQPSGENFEVSYEGVGPNSTLGNDYITVHAGTEHAVVEGVIAMDKYVLVLVWCFKEYINKLFVYEMDDLSKKAIVLDFSDIREGGEHYSLVLFSGLHDGMHAGKVIPLMYEYFDESSFLFGYTSLIQPVKVFSYQIVHKLLVLVSEQKYPGYKKSEFKDRLIFINSTNNVTKETVEVPVFIAHKKGIVFPTYTHLELFSTYGVISKPMYGIDNYVYMSGYYGYNFIYGFVNARGSMTKGFKWWTAGKGAKGRLNTYQDLISVLKHMNYWRNKLSRAEMMTVSGFGHGGTIVASAAVREPGKIGLACVEMGYLDNLNTMLDDKLPFVVKERVEIGDPTVKEDFEAMLELDPYFNIKKGDKKKKINSPKYPNIFIEAAKTSRRFMYWDALKFPAAARDAKDPKWETTINPQIYYGNYDEVLMHSKKVSYIFKTITGWRWHDPLEWLWILISILVLGAWMLFFMTLFILVEIRSKQKKTKKDYAPINDEEENQTGADEKVDDTPTETGYGEQ